MKKQIIKRYGTSSHKTATFKDTFKVVGLSLACIAAVGITYMSVNLNQSKSNNISEDKNKNYLVSKAESSSIEEKVEHSNDKKNKSNSKLPSNTNSSGIITEKVYNEPEITEAVNEDEIYETQSAVNASASVVILSRPINGKLIKEYSIDKPLYSKTLEDWRIHKGIDIASKMGTTVCASASGVVEEVKKDILFGYTIVINHGNNVKTVYCNLTGTAMVQVGKDLKKGDPIGMVGDSAICETSDEAHLHFEVVINDENVNPLNYFSL